MTLVAAAIFLSFITTLCYVSVCATSPFGNCRKCSGLGFRLRTDRRGKPRRGRDCRRCQSRGKRIRTGRHLFNAVARIYRDGFR